MAVTLRNIKEEDLELIMQWRMAPEITRYMNTDPKLTLEGQKRWLASISAKDSVRYWLIEVNGQPAGVINLVDLDNPNGDIGWAYYVGEKALRSMKVALSLEMSMYDYVFDVLRKKAVYADIFSLNTGVIALHKICGCEITEEIKNHVEKNGINYDVTFMRMTVDRWNSIREGKNYERINFDIPED